MMKVIMNNNNRQWWTMAWLCLIGWRRSWAVRLLRLDYNSQLLGTFQTSLGHFRQVSDISDKSWTFQTNSFLTLRITPDTHEYRNVICSKHKQMPSYNQLNLFMTLINRWLFGGTVWEQQFPPEHLSTQTSHRCHCWSCWKSQTCRWPIPFNSCGITADWF